MARVLTPQDAHVIMGELVKQATGQSSISAINSSNFASVGEKVLATGTENVINSLSLVLGKTFMAVRPYNAKLKIINALNSGVYTNRLRKISVYNKLPKASGHFNTDLFTNFANGYTNGRNNDGTNDKSTKSQWEQNQPVVAEKNFAGQSVWDDSLTIYEDQLQVAFQSDVDFTRFMNGIMTEKYNDIEMQKEAYNRMCILNEIGMLYDMQNDTNRTTVVNLTTEFNQKYGTTHTSNELRTTYIKDFLQSLTFMIRQTSDFMTDKSVNYHWADEKTVDGEKYYITRQTPKDKQRLILYTPLFNEARTMVMPEIFNPEYLSIENYEGVNYWQSIENKSQVNVVPAIIDTKTGEQKAGSAVNLPYVVGLLYDVDAMMIDYQLESSRSTPVEARKGYRNIWWNFSRNAINDPTENAVLFIMQDE